MATKGF